MMFSLLVSVPVQVCAHTRQLIPQSLLSHPLKQSHPSLLRTALSPTELSWHFCCNQLNSRTDLLSSYVGQHPTVLVAGAAAVRYIESCLYSLLLWLFCIFMYILERACQFLQKGGWSLIEPVQDTQTSSEVIPSW